MLRALSTHLFVNHRLTTVWLDRIWERMVTRFDAGVAARLGPDVNLVYGYEHACRETFRRAGELGIRRVFDMAAPHYSARERRGRNGDQTRPLYLTASRPCP